MNEPRIGYRLPDLERPLGIVDLVMYAAATWDWYRWHYDATAAADAHLPGPLVDGQMLGALLARHALEWAGPRARTPPRRTGGARRGSTRTRRSPGIPLG